VDGFDDRVRRNGSPELVDEFRILAHQLVDINACRERLFDRRRTVLSSNTHTAEWVQALLRGKWMYWASLCRGKQQTNWRISHPNMSASAQVHPGRVAHQKSSDSFGFGWKSASFHLMGDWKRESDIDIIGVGRARQGDD